MKNINRRQALARLGIATSALAAGAPINTAEASGHGNTEEHPIDRARWHLAEARRLLEESTGNPWDLDLDIEVGVAIVTKRERPGVWRSVQNADGSMETHFMTNPVIRRRAA